MPINKFILLTLISCPFLSLGQPKQIDTLIKCQKDWKYLEIKKEMTGTILFYDQPTFFCGRISTASIAILKTETGDTIRILTLCHIRLSKAPNEFTPGDIVTVTPTEAPSFQVDFVPYDPQVCIIKTAYFGSIRFLKANNNKKTE
ncbi:MAG: hypothetical protein ABIN95_01050 [Mucilaginibacter sp.]